MAGRTLGDAITHRFLFAAILLLAFVSPAVAQSAPPAAPAADVSGTWKASFDTQIGVQNYTYELVQKASALTGKITSDNGTSEVKAGKVENGTITFTETLDFGGMTINIIYTGKLASADEIKFTRQVGDLATEELVAKRAK
ncbi:MAG: hypothetical protein ABI634_17180 [Acidobacteriota bacterium]